jgi:hypothetical protein
VSLCVWHLPEHYAQDVPSPKLIEQWNRIIQYRSMQDSDVPNSLARASIQSLIQNGIFFPIWKMTACEFNDSRGLKLQLRNNNMALFWYPSPEEFEKRVQSAAAKLVEQGTHREPEPSQHQHFEKMASQQKQISALTKKVHSMLAIR